MISKLDPLRQDIRYGLRVLRSKPAITVIALLALALGIGANTALFSILYAVLWKPLPFRDPDRLVMVWEASSLRNHNVANPADYMDWKEQNNVFEDVAAFAQTGSANLTGGDEPEEVPLQYATPNLFRVLGVQPVLGRDFADTDGAGEDIVLILSNGLWRRRFNADRGIVGKQIRINGRKGTVVGVMPPDWTWFVKEGAMITKPPELWVAFPITSQFRVRGGRYLTTIARLKPGVTLQQSQANMDLIAKRLEKQYPEFNSGWSVNVVPLRDQFSGSLRGPLWVLSLAVVLVLLIACTNVANLLLARAIQRSREIALRSALGADRMRLVRQLLTESFLLSVLGGLAGLLLAVWGTELLAFLAKSAGLGFVFVKIQLPVLMFALVLSLLTGLFFGIVPALVASQYNLQDQLKEGSKGTRGLSVGKFRNALVVSQLAFALVLLSGAMLLIQSFSRLSSVNPGFNADHVLTLRLLLPSIKYPEDPQRIQFFQNVLEKVRSLPGVKSAGMVNYLPFRSLSAGTSFTIVGRPAPPPSRLPSTNVFVVDTEFFHVLQIPLKQGRLFMQGELSQAKGVVLINEALARQYFVGENPIGQKIVINMKNTNTPSEIIGIVGNAKQEQLDTPDSPSVYWPYPELTNNFMTIVVRTTSDPLALVPAATSAIRGMDSEQPVSEIRTMDEWLGDSTAKARFNTTLLSVLAMIALILAVAGIYGVMSHAVAQRTQEMGIRIALGASKNDVFKLVIKDGSRMVLTGIAIGFVATLLFTRVMKSMLFETSPTDPLVFVIVISLLILAGIAACWIPSRRAARISPIEALHFE